MPRPYENLISATDLTAEMANGRLVILDCRAKLGDLKWGQQEYAAGHIDGAVHADLDRQLASAPGAAGRHPLPPMSEWVATLQSWGVSEDTQVGVYDDMGGAMAARAWWMLRWAGHGAVALLDGGLQAWQQPLSTEVPNITPSNFAAGPSLATLVRVEDLLAADQPHNLVDARAEPRFAGREEPIDPVAGHIPGAVCFPFQANLGSDGRFLSKSELQARFAELPDPLVCYCGSGVTACHNLLALHICGRDAALYADSWSGWITDPGRPVATS